MVDESINRNSILHRPTGRAAGGWVLYGGWCTCESYAAADGNKVNSIINVPRFVPADRPLLSSL